MEPQKSKSPQIRLLSWSSCSQTPSPRSSKCSKCSGVRLNDQDFTRISMMWSSSFRSMRQDWRLPADV